MSTKELNTEQITDFENRIEYMERHIQIFKWESCIKILTYLNLYGKKQASELRDLIELKGEKSIYKSLKVLLDAGKIAKEADPNSQRDAKAYYYTSGDSVHDPSFDAEFVKYLIQMEKYGLIADYMTNANKASISFIRVTTDIMRRHLENNQKSNITGDFLGNYSFFESVFSTPNPKEFHNKLKTFLKNEVRPLMNAERDNKQPLPNPVSLFIAYMPLLFETK